MSRCFLYITNRTGATITPVHTWGSDWNSACNLSANIPPTGANVIVASMESPSGASSAHWGNVYFKRVEGSTTAYFYVFFKLRNANDCMEMGISSCTQSEASDDKERYPSDRGMPSNGTENAVKTCKDYNNSVMRWNPAKSGADQVGFFRVPCMFVEIH